MGGGNAYTEPLNCLTVGNLEGICLPGLTERN
jgi:hypothetical protein